jgi:nucleotide-binding universal stress UspA family protein
MLAASARGEDAFDKDVVPRSLHRIVIGVDFSNAALGAAQWAGRHLARDATLSLVHVIEPPPLPNGGRLRLARIPYPDSRLQARIQSLRGALYGLGRAIGAGSTRGEVRVGDPALQLAAYADMVDADLVVVGGNAAPRAASRHETATTERLLRRLDRPVLVARNSEAAPTTVLAALGDDVSTSVLTAAQMVAAPCAGHVATLRISESTNVLVGTRDAVGARRQVRKIIDVARKLRAGVIVVGSQLFAAEDDDDAAHMVARAANCSVLVVPHPAQGREASSSDHGRRHPVTLPRYFTKESLEEL